MDQAKQFFEAMYGELGSDECIELRCLGGSANQRLFKGNAQVAAESARRLIGKGNVYFGVSLRDGNGGRKANIVRITCAWADLDAREGLESPSERIKRAALPPSAIVSSGKGLHCYWFLTENLYKKDMDFIEDLNKRVAAVIGGDSVHDVTRVLRVPGSVNTKYGEPLPVELVELDSAKRYTIEQMCDAFPKPAAPSAPVQVKRAGNPAAMIGRRCLAGRLCGKGFTMEAATIPVSSLLWI